MGLSWGWLDTQCLMELLKCRDWNHDSEIIKIHQKIILIIVMIITTKYLLLGAFYVSSYLTSQEPHKIFTILIPLFRCRNPRLRWYRNLLSITQPVKCRSGTWTQVCFTPESTPLWFSYQESSPGSQEALTGSACSPWVPPSWDPRATITMFQTLVTKKKTENYCLTILEARVQNQALGQFCVWWQRDRELCCGDLLTLAFVSWPVQRDLVAQARPALLSQSSVGRAEGSILHPTARATQGYTSLGPGLGSRIASNSSY